MLNNTEKLIFLKNQILKAKEQIIDLKRCGICRHYGAEECLLDHSFRDRHETCHKFE